ncbi:MAG: glucuronate isomerase [Gaiellaceae bacterium]
MPFAESERLDPDRLLGASAAQRALARRLYDRVAGLPIVSPHGHVPVELLAEPEARLSPPGRLFVTGDHYILRMLYSQGIPLEALGLRPLDGSPAEEDDRKIWQLLADSFRFFAGTPSGLWLNATLADVFGVEERLSAASAEAIYDQVAARLVSPELAPRALLDRFEIELLATTDAAESDLAAHRRLRADGLAGRVPPTFRPGTIFAIGAPDWCGTLTQFERVCGLEIAGYQDFVLAIEERRRQFIELGAKATDHAVESVQSERLMDAEAEAIFRRALAGELEPGEADRFAGHMLWESARMSREDGLVMQIRAGSVRDYNPKLADRFGPDIGADIPVSVDWTRGLRPLLVDHGSDPALHLILSTLDEAGYSRELAPLAGHYPAVLLGPPWWFHDSPNGTRRYLDSVTETAGFQNLSGFADDAHNLVAIPARHDIWRRASCSWLASRVLDGALAEEDAAWLAGELACGLARRAFRLPAP